MKFETEVAQADMKLSTRGGHGQPTRHLAGERDKDVNSLKGTYDQLVDDLKAELDSGKVRIEQLENGIRLSVDDDVLFPSGSAELDSNGESVIKKVAAQVADSENRVEVIGHTDDRKIRKRLAERYPTNWELGGARASSVVRLLAREGVDGTRLRATSLGEFEPLAANDSEEKRAKNRRIEIRLMPPDPATHTTLASD